MPRLIVSPQAELDTAAIVEMLEERAGGKVALRYRREFQSLFERLIMFPESGAKRPEFGPSARLAVTAPYVVIYDYHADDIVILRVVDGRRNITRRLVRG